MPVQSESDQSEPATELRKFARDLVALSTVPLIWTRADARQIGQALAQLSLSLLPADHVCVVLDDPQERFWHASPRTDDRPPEPADIADRLKPNRTHEVVTNLGVMRAFCVPIGTDSRSRIAVFAASPGFPSANEQTLLRIMANQAAAALIRWRGERDLIEQTARLEVLNQHTASLFRFTDRVFRSVSVEAVYEAALDAICETLRVSMASVLRFDANGVMRFVRWRALSDNYRQAVDGHSPWSTDDAQVRPIYIENIADMADGDPLKAIIFAEGIRSLAFFPIMANGRLVGKFMAYSPVPRRFTETEQELALSIARQLGFGIERRNAEDELRRASERLRVEEERARIRANELAALMESVPAVIWRAHDPDCRQITGNRASYDFLKLPPGKNPSLSAPEGERPTHFRVFHGGKALEPFQLPVQRAARGEEVRDFEVAHHFDDGTVRYLFGNAVPLHDDENQLRGALAAFVDITDRKKAEEVRDLVVAELSHRVKNTLAIVLAIARRTFQDKTRLEETAALFERRIHALALTHTRLAEANWAGVPFEMLLADELQPYLVRDRPRVRPDGPSVLLKAKCALSLGMAIHELATNAAKYGSLSTNDGSIDIRWRVGGDQTLHIDWRENGGPSVRPPQRSGFGRLLLERVLTADLKGNVTLDFAPAGVTCRIAVPLDQPETYIAIDRARITVPVQ